MKDRDVDYLILQYLKKKGYKDAELVFRRDSKVDAHEDSHSVSLNHQLDADHSLQDLLLFYAAEQDHQAFVDAFDKLVAFVDGSLDLYKPELQRGLYPVFVHVYLQLVAYGAPNKAAELLKRYRRRLVEVGGRQSNVRVQELQELQSVALVQHLDVNPFAKAARSSRSNLRMCTHSFELLMHYLQGNKQWLILNIINKHIAFELHEGRPLLLDVLAGDEEGTGLLQGRAGEAAGTINSTALNLSLLKDNSEDGFASQRVQEREEALTQAVAAAQAAANQAAEQQGGMDIDGEQQLSLAVQQANANVRRIKALKDKVLAGAKAKLKAMQDARRAPTIPLLPLEDKVVSRQQQDCAARVVVTPNELPSCCFFTLVNTRHGGVTAVTSSPDTKYLAAGFSDSVVRIYSLELLGRARTKLSKQHRGPRPDAKRQRGLGGDAAALEPHIDVETEAAELQEELSELSGQGISQLPGHSGSITGLAYSSDQALLFSSSTDGSVRLWSTEYKRGLASYRSHMYPVWDVAACPHGTYFVSGGADQTARMWSTERVRPLRVFDGHQSDVDVVCWHPNSHYIATGSSDRTVRLWDPANGSCVRVLTAQTSCVTCLGFSPDGQQLAAGTEDGTVAVYDLGSARRMALLEGHVGPVWSLSYSQGGGSLLATGGADRTLRLFSCPKGDNVVELVSEELSAAAALGDIDPTAPAHSTGLPPAAASGGSKSRAGAVAAGGAAGAAGGLAGSSAAAGHGHGHPGAGWQPYQLLKTFTTQSMPVVYVGFSPRNLLLAAGPWTLPAKVVSSRQR